MSIPPSDPAPGPGRAPHQHRRIAEAFGSDADTYDRTRPHYPPAMVDEIIAASPGTEVLDVGAGTGIAARQFCAARCSVLGIEPDARMAEVARAGWAYRQNVPAPASYSAVLTTAVDSIGNSGVFSEPQRWQFAWQQTYTRDEWLDQVPTHGGHADLPPATLGRLLSGLSDAIDAMGGGFTMNYTTAVVTAVVRSGSG